METEKTVGDIKVPPPSLGRPELERKITELEEQVRTLTQDRQAMELHFAAKLQAIRHDVAQPLMTVQFFLDLLPGVLQQEQLDAARFVNQNYWNNTYHRALAALKTIPKIVEG